MEEPELIQEPEPEEEEREGVLRQLEAWLDTPMMVLAFAWLLLFLADLMYPPNQMVQSLLAITWIIFIADFVIRFLIAPKKVQYVVSEWPMVLAMILPAFRMFRMFRAVRIFRVARVSRGAKLVRTIGSVNRGMSALKDTMGRRGFGYVLILSVVVVLVGAGGLFVFERGLVDGTERISTFEDALWWAVMMMTTVGAAYSPITTEGRVLGFILALYGFSVFGYVTATLATFFVDRDAEESKGKVASTRSVEALGDEIAALRAEIRLLVRDNRRDG
jgi:voltage-gated potassium channel